MKLWIFHARSIRRSESPPWCSHSKGMILCRKSPLKALKCRAFPTYDSSRKIVSFCKLRVKITGGDRTRIDITEKVLKFPTSIFLIFQFTSSPNLTNWTYCLSWPGKELKKYSHLTLSQFGWDPLRKYYLLVFHQLFWYMKDHLGNLIFRDWNGTILAFEDTR